MHSFFVWTSKQLLLYGLLLSIASTLWGAEINLYEVELPTQTANQNFNQNNLLEQAFRMVVVRLSGSDKILQVPLMIQALKETQKYINQFSYHQRSNQERYIKVVFNKNQVQQLFKRIGTPIASTSHPLTLIWLVIERDKGPAWVGDSEPLITKEVEKLLHARAIPFVFPLQDLTDTTHVSEQDVVNEAIEPLQQNAKRYGAEAILLGRLSQKGTDWHGHWALIQEGNKASWDTLGATVNTVLNVAMEEFSTKIADKKGTIPTLSDQTNQTVSTRTTLAISGISSSEQYTRILEYLRRLPGVLEVETIEVTPEKTIFHVEGTSEENIVNAIGKDRLLVKNPLDEQEENGMLVYKILGE